MKFEYFSSVAYFEFYECKEQIKYKDSYYTVISKEICATQDTILQETMV